MSVKRWKDVADVQEELDALKDMVARAIVKLNDGEKPRDVSEFLENALKPRLGC